MALPYAFANVSQLNTPELDADFNAVGALVTIPCTATGTNTIALTPTANTPTVAAYTSLAPQFAFIAAATSNGAVTANFNGLGAKKLYKNNGATQAGSGDIISGSLYTCVYNSALDSAVGGLVLTNQSIAIASPTVQRFVTAGAGTYTPPAGLVRAWIRIVGGGGGGGARTTNSGTAGTATAFKDWTAAAGAAGTVAGAGGAGGGGGTDGTGTLVVRILGATGGVSAMQVDASGDGQASFVGGMGGASFFGGAGPTGATAGGAARANSGSGGAGGSSLITVKGGGGGGGAEYAEFYMTAAQIGASCSYTVGAKGVGGAAGGAAGGDGADGYIIVVEQYI